MGVKRMATPRNPKGTKPPARKRKPTPKAIRRTMIEKTMTPQPEPRESVMLEGHDVTKISDSAGAFSEPITLEGTFDDAAFPFPWTMEPQKQLTIVASRRFLWWEVSRQRIKLTVKAQPHTVTQAPDGAITYSVPMKLDGPCEAIPSPWWERALYAVARIWS